MRREEASGFERGIDQHERERTPNSGRLQPSADRRDVRRRRFGYRRRMTSQSRLVELARLILSRTLEPIDGARRMVAAMRDLSDEQRHDAAILTIVAIESETDHLPIGATRDLWEPRALAEVDAQRRDIEQRVEPDLFAAARDIIARFSDQQ